jgi:hypothetical protein
MARDGMITSFRTDEETVRMAEELEAKTGMSRSALYRRAVALLYEQELESSTPARKQFEYKTQPLTFDRELNALGADGWEAVSVWFDHNNNEPYVLLKRCVC